MKYPLEDRCREFADRTIIYCRQLPTDVVTRELVRQLVRSAGSVAANYFEANESLSKKDFLFHLRIARKEAKESELWLYFLRPMEKNSTTNTELQKEANELLRIFTAIIKKSE